MKILKNYEDLVGKTIAFSHMAQFADQITLATTDGEVLMATFDYNDEEDSVNIRVLWENSVIRVLNDHEWLRTELSRVGAFDLEEYMKQKKEEYRIAAEKREKEQVGREIELLAELKAKYEDSVD